MRDGVTPLGGGVALDKAQTFTQKQTFAGAADVTGDVTATGGDIVAASAGKGLKVKGGAGGRVGTASLTAGSVTVANTSVTANSRVFVTRQGSGQAVAASYSVTVNAGTGFTIASSNGADNSTVQYFIVEQG